MNYLFVNRKMLLCFLIIFLGSVPVKSQELSTKIRVNQIGFYANAPKKAVIEQDISGSFYIISEETGARTFSGTLSGSRKSKYGDKVVRIADFSSYRSPGIYRLKVPSVGISYPFRIGSNVLINVAQASLKGYYFQRASTALPEKYAQQWFREAGHRDDSVLIHASAATSARPEGTVINSSKGWYDAGDYNKYIVNSGISMATLMSVYEDFPTYAKTIELKIPEEDNNIPDLMDEVLWNLRWMLTMQDPNDGGVYHKLTSAGFSGMVKPVQDKAKRYVVQKSTAATLDFAAVMAQASRIYDDYDETLPGLADSCLTAAKNAWEWAHKNPDRIYDQRKLNEQFDPDITTGAYGDRNVDDEFAWAAAELLVTTQNEDYYSFINTPDDKEILIPSWSKVEALGYYTLLRFKGELSSVPAKDLTQIRDHIIAYANKLVQGGNGMAYMTVMGYQSDNFVWGSTSVAANQAILLIQAYKLTSRQKYLNAALSNVDYLLGRNATGYSFVTGHGDKTPMYPHHRPSVSDGVVEPVPGLLVGGPNSGQQDGCKYPSDLPNESYSDTVCSYASNEITINWNAPLVYVLYAVQALKVKASYVNN